VSPARQRFCTQQQQVSGQPLPLERQGRSTLAIFTNDPRPVKQSTCDIARLHAGEGVSRSYFTRLVRLSYLAPDITQAILDGRQPRDLTPEKLLEHSRLPLAWHEQRATLGFT
jgi:hypothetical protein